VADDEKVKIAVLEEQVRTLRAEVTGIGQKLWAVIALVIAFVVNNLMEMIGK
jgi:hypothetical protein